MGDNVDTVLVGFPVPSGCTVRKVKLDFAMVKAAAVGIVDAVMYGFDGWLLPLLDPDGAQVLDTIWDTLVPKMSQDLDFELSDSADTTSFFEPGELVSETILDMNINAPERVFKRRRMLTFAGPEHKGFVEAGLTWTPTDMFKTTQKGNYFAERESALLYAVGAPNMDQDTGNNNLLPTGATIEWAMLKYIDHILDMMIVHVLGLGTAGSGTVPWDDAEDFIEAIVSDFGPSTNNMFVGMNSAQYWCIASCFLDVPGSVPKGILKAD